MDVQQQREISMRSYLFSKTRITYLAIALLVGVAACQESTPVNPGPEPSPTSMTFKSGSRYQYDSYHTDAATDARTDSSARTRIWTLTSTNATVNGKTGVAVYVDSVFSAGGLFNVADSVYLQQGTTNDVYRYSSLVPELDVNVGGITLFDVGKSWMHEAKLNATSAQWFVSDIADTIPNTFGLPLVSGIRLSVTDSAVASAIETMTISGVSYQTTKTTHALVFKVSVLTSLGGFTVPVDVATKSTTRTSWIAPALGAIVKEDRPGVVLDASYQGQGFSIPIPGYHSTMVSVLATGT
jgi:hypothetical protein